MKNYLMTSHRFMKKIISLLPMFMLFSMTAMAQPKPPSTLSNPLAQALVVIMVLLALAIAILANVVNNAASMFRDRMRKERQVGKGGIVSSVVTLFMLFSPIMALSQEEAVPVAVTNNLINGISPMVFYLMVGVIAVEIIILIALVYQLKFLMGLEKERAVVAESLEAEAKPKESWWWKFNRSTDISNEAAIDLNKDYDGITELDNRLPPWWTVAFGITILFSVVYLYRYHVGKTAPLQAEEFQIAMRRAEAERAAFLAKSASNVDENTVVLLDAAGIASGKSIFAANCVACHGALGEGNTVGPNLTDDYWIHGGSLGDIFRTIKYGVVEKGMRSWKDDLTPMQMAQVTSYIRSLHGTNPPNAREPQGEKFIEEEGEEKAAEEPVEGTAGL
jgi:cytochrome c oxidase cbb3-type subunit III